MRNHGRDPSGVRTHDCEVERQTPYPLPLYSICILTSLLNISGVYFQNAIHVDCSEYTWNIVVDMNRLRQTFPNAKASDIYLGENKCTGIERNGHLTFQQGLDECLTSGRVGYSFSDQIKKNVRSQYPLLYTMLSHINFKDTLYLENRKSFDLFFKYSHS